MRRTRNLLRRRISAGQRRAEGRGDGGFTLSELLVVIILLGMIVAPLSTALIQILRIVPVAEDRSEAAADRAVFTSRFEDDVANTTSLPATSLLFCPAGTAPLTIPITFWWYDPETDLTKWVWTLYLFRYSTHSSGLTKFELLRWEIRAGGGGTGQAVNVPHLTGYCTPGDLLALWVNSAPNATYPRRQFGLYLWLRDRATEPLVVTRFGGQPRTPF